MTKKEFKYAMERGLGRCVWELRKTEDVEKYRDIVMWGCTHNLAYDYICEGTRSYFLYDMIREYEDVTPFLQAAKECVKKKYRTSSLDVIQACRLLAEFAEEGNEYACKSLEECFEFYYKHLVDLTRLKKGEMPDWMNFEELMISFVTYSKDMEVIEQRLIQVAAALGKLIESNKLFSKIDFAWFYDGCRYRFERSERDRILREGAEHSKDIQIYLNTVKQAENRRKEKEKQKRQQTKAQAVTAEWIYEQIKSNPKMTKLKLYRLTANLQQKEEKEEIEKLAELYIQEKDVVIREKLLRVLGQEEYVYALDVNVVLQDAQSDSKELEETACCVLGNIKDERVYNYALSLLHSKGQEAEAANMLIANYREEDEELFVNLVKKIPINRKSNWHIVFSGIKELFRNKDIKNPPRSLLYYMYENTKCAYCREFYVKEMGRRRMLTKKIVMECLLDSYCDTCNYADKVVKRRRAQQQKKISYS